MNKHDTALVDPAAIIASSARIGPYAVVESDVRIGDRTEIRSHSCIKRFSTLDSDNTVYEGVILGGEPQDLGYSECESFLRIGSRNRIRENVTMHRGAQPGSETVVGSDCLIMAGAHVAHNCRLGDRVIIANNVALAGYVDVADASFISGGVVVHQFTRIGRLAMIGGNSKIVQDCLPFVITDGATGRASGLNIVGLWRAGWTSSSIQGLKKAYRILLRSSLSLENAVDLMKELKDTLVDELIDFVSSSKRGFCR